MSRDEFYDLTIRELYREFVVTRERLENERARDLTLAWTIEALHRREKLPPLDELLSPRRAGPAPQATQRAALAVLSEQYGIPLRKTRLRRVIAWPTR